jgi:hypothetical protein
MPTLAELLVEYEPFLTIRSVPFGSLRFYVRTARIVPGGAGIALRERRGAGNGGERTTPPELRRAPGAK